MPDANPTWQAALAFAARAHQGQMRKDGRTPYISHIARVVTTLSALFGCTDETTLTIAALHDTIEDTTVDYDEIAEHFGTEVADGVAALSKNALLPEKEREAEYDQRLARADWRIRLIKLADVYDNLCDADDRNADPAKVRKRIEKAERAMKLAEGDRERAEVGRALAAIGQRIWSVE